MVARKETVEKKLELMIREGSEELNSFINELGLVGKFPLEFTVVDFTSHIQGETPNQNTSISVSFRDRGRKDQRILDPQYAPRLERIYKLCRDEAVHGNVEIVETFEYNPFSVRFEFLGKKRFPVHEECTILVQNGRQEVARLHNMSGAYQFAISPPLVRANLPTLVDYLWREDVPREFIRRNIARVNAITRGLYDVK